MGGAVGIDGNVVLAYLALHIKSRKKRSKLFQQILLISKGALFAMSDKRAKDKKNA